VTRLRDGSSGPGQLDPTLPRVAIVGRPNVGKSTLLNRVVGRRIAIVEEHPGVTRDRFEVETDWRGRRFVLVDTGGMTDDREELQRAVTGQALRAIREAELVIFLLDAATGLTAEDDVVADLLRRNGPDKVLVVANKVDSAGQEPDAWSVSGVGLGIPVQVSALHGRGVGDLLDVVVERLGERAPELAGPIDPEDEILPGKTTGSTPSGMPAVAIVGRPNVGKSTLFNRLVGDERVVVHDVPGTTRDAIDTILETDDGPLRLIDTAGLRRRSRIGEGSEYYSLVRSLSAIDKADVSLLVIDATEGVSHQEQRLAERVDAAGSPIVLVLNKWDLTETDKRVQVTAELDDRLGFLAYAPVLKISAKTGLGVHRLLPAIGLAIEAYHRRIPTGRLNDAIRIIQSEHSIRGARVLYAVQGAVDPPTITLFATRRLPPTYLRYIEHSLRERFKLGPTPLKLRVRLRAK